MRKAKSRWKVPKGELYIITHAYKKLQKECIGRRVVLYIDHIVWTDLELKIEDDMLARYLMDVMKVASQVIFIREVENTVADTITRMLASRTASVDIVDRNKIWVPEE
eukprot:TRINITY_DN10676_c0_g1_i1.p1 TRINITY_DN10676_c0_g1~~TRINITY_DN10676_c0_g1_i1.p1  ORF type:complete len:108 (-),score=17.45 TRINITY_DN10676_c0_g1_i1:762-1085(-)